MDEPGESTRTRRSRRVLSALLLVMGVLHFVVPSRFDALIPGFLGSPRPWVLGSGVAELATGGLLASHRTRRIGGWVAALTFVAVFPGNIKMAIDAGNPMASPSAFAVWLRLPLQIPLVLWARSLTRAD